MATEAAYTVVLELGPKLDRGQDASEVRLQVYRDEEYFQYIRAFLSGQARHLEKAGGDEPGKFWLAFCHEVCDEIQRAIRRKELPLADDRQPYEVWPRIEVVMERARTIEGEAKVGEVVYEFRL